MMNANVRYFIQSPPVPQDFVDLTSLIRDVPLSFREPPSPVQGVVDVEWDTSGMTRFATESDVGIRIPDLFDQGGIFMFGPTATAHSSHRSRYRRYVVGARFNLDNNGDTLNNAARMAWDQGAVSSVSLLLPNTPSIRSSYAPGLEASIAHRLGLTSGQITIIYYQFYKTNPIGALLAVSASYFAAVQDYRVRPAPASTNLAGPSRPAQAVVVGAMLRDSARLVAHRPHPMSTLPTTNHGYDSRFANFVLPRKPSDIPNTDLPLVASASAEVSTQSTTDVGWYTSEGVKMTDDSDLRILNLGHEGALFIWGTDHPDGSRWIVGAKFSFSNDFTLLRAARMTYALGLISRVTIMLPESPDTISRYQLELSGALRTILHIQPDNEITVSYYQPITGYAQSITARLSSFELESAWYPATVHPLYDAGPDQARASSPNSRLTVSDHA